MLTFTKDGGKKFIDPKSSLIPALKADGWECSDLPEEDELSYDDLKAKATEMGIEFKGNIGKVKLATLIEKASQ